MKKTALVLALLMLFTLAFSACAKTGIAAPASESPSPATAAPATIAPEVTQAPATQTPAEPAGPTEEELKNSKPNEYIKEKLAAGMEVTVAAIMISDVATLMEIFATDIRSVVEAEGCKFIVTHAGGDVANMVSQIENYSSMGVSCIVIVPVDAGTIKDAVLAAMKKGTDVVTYGVEGNDYSYSTRPDTVISSEHLAKMGIAWAKQRYPDASATKPVKFGVFYNSNVAAAIAGRDKCKEVVRSDSACELVFADDGIQGNVDYGVTTAENALSFDPGIRVFLCSTMTTALGISNYIISMPGIDFSEYSVFTNNYDDTTLKQINELAPDNESVLRGTIATVDRPGISIGKTALIALFDEQPAPYDNIMNSVAIVSPDFNYKDEF